MKVIGAWIMITLVFVLGSCSLFEDPQEQTEIEIKSEFRLELNQLLIPGPNPLVINVSTIDPPKCKESKIRILKSHDNEEIFLGIIDILNPLNCEITNEVIVESSNFLLNDGQFGFTLDLNASVNNQFENSIINFGTLNSSSESFKLIFDTQNGFELANMEVQKIPDQLFWGYIMGESQEELLIFNDLLSHISSHIDDNLGIKDGNYGYFTLQDGQISKINIENSPGFSKSFIFHSNTAAASLSDVFNDFRNQYPDVLLHVQHSEGLVF